ncbi:membrane protein [Lentimicrobium saccharophilum]|uniref:Membrane protein n=1 Tax=Lentimicrobium saccharophilum TaxID=1678841 RepID=A0A0S7C0F2_9BACT|nr:oligosaccharide flippase family protein [Lentimicrobium saccharophilum]GAP43124.1 membrane protein [Lentimicrobium saccharophilum]
MQRKFLTNLGFLLLLNLLIKPFWIFGIDRTVQNVVGAEDFGFYFAIFNFSFLFNILFDFGITNFNNRNIAQNSQLLNKHFSSIIILKFLLAVVYFIVTFSVGIIWGYRGNELWMLGLLGINQFLISFILYLRSNVSALLLFKTDSLLSVLDRMLMIAICSVLLWGRITDQTFRIEWFVYAQTVSYALTALIALLIVIKKASFRRLNWNFPFFLMIIRQSLPFAILVLLMTFYNRIDSVMIERLIGGVQGKEQSGIYAHAYRLLDASNNIAYLFSVLLLPLFARQIKSGERVENLVRLSFTLLFVVSVILAAVSWFYRVEIMDLMYDHFIPESASVFGVLMGCFIAISTTYVFGTLLTANGNLKQLNLIAAGGMLLNISLNVLLIPRFGALGSAWTSLITQGIMAIAQIILVLIFFRFKFNPKFLGALLVFVIGVVLINRVAVSLPLYWLQSLILAIFLSVFLALVLRLLNLRYFIRLIASPAG